MGAKLRYLVARGEGEEAEGEIGGHRGQGLGLFEEKEVPYSAFMAEGRQGFGLGHPEEAGGAIGTPCGEKSFWSKGDGPHGTAVGFEGGKNRAGTQVQENNLSLACSGGEDFSVLIEGQGIDAGLPRGPGADQVFGCPLPKEYRSIT
jgi:hypothetical protein